VLADRAGPATFCVGQDWGPDVDQMVRREGDEDFGPQATVGTQPYPNYPDTDEPITLIFTARKDNGKTGLIVGTPTTLYRYFALEDQAIVAAGVVASGILGTISDGTWLTIGSGYTTLNAHRWEACNVGGKTYFNNGVDLPVSYDLYEFAVKPVYELREQGVAFVGTIMEVAGVLVAMDIAEIHAAALSTIIGLVGYGGFANGPEDNFHRIPQRMVLGAQGGGWRGGATVPGAITAGTRTLTLENEVLSIGAGDAIRVVGAGVDGADLLTTVGYKSGTGVWILLDEAETTVAEAAVGLQDAAALKAGAFDLLDDSSPILRGVKTQDETLIIAKSTGFIMAQYSGNPAAPFSFVRLYTGSGALFYRWTLTDIGGALVYAGQDDFYVFDLVTRRPRAHPRLTLCRGAFFAAVAGMEQDEVFASDNQFTKEVWFHYDGAVLAYSYRRRELGGDRCSVVGTGYTAAAMVEKPSATVAHQAAEEWFLVGTAAGKVLQYGFERTGPTLWTRQGVAYNSDLWAGQADMGDAGNEKHIDQYLLLFASQPAGAAVTVGLWATRNPDEALTELAGSPVTIATPRNAVNMHFLVHLIQDRIRAAGTSNVRIVKRQWSGRLAGGASFQRR